LPKEKAEEAVIAEVEIRLRSILPKYTRRAEIFARNTASSPFAQRCRKLFLQLRILPKISSKKLCHKFNLNGSINKTKLET
jgi:hypothetical protein